MSSTSIARLLITCPDRPGIVASVTNFLYNHGANIIALDQYTTDPEGGNFFMRLEFHSPELDESRTAFQQSFAQAVAEPLQMDWQLNFADTPKRMALFVSKYDHAFLELLWRWSRHELPGNVVMVISNHPDMKEITEQRFGLPYHEIPVTKDNKAEAEAKTLEILKDQVDLIVLARYMQILTEDFISHYPHQIINIHHSFLPAFKGAKPHQQAHDKGVKLIGATAHYATADLDMGPIIEQDVIRVSHRDTPKELKELGQDVERNVLTRAVKWHLEDRIIVYQNKTIVFS